MWFTFPRFVLFYFVTFNRVIFFSATFSLVNYYYCVNRVIYDVVDVLSECIKYKYVYTRR